MKILTIFRTNISWAL